MHHGRGGQGTTSFGGGGGCSSTSMQHHHHDNEGVGERVGERGGNGDSESDVPLSDLEDDDDEDDEDEEDEEEDLPYPGFIPLALGCLEQHTRPRSWCLRMITNPYPFQCKLFIIYVLP